jgi:hypothetical protein
MAAGAGGGIPHVARDSFDTTGREVKLPFFVLYLIARNQGANPARLYFTEEDYTNDANYVLLPVPSAIYPYGEWRGPVETTQGKYQHVFIKGVGGATTVELVGFQRRG